MLEKAAARTNPYVLAAITVALFTLVRWILNPVLGSEAPFLVFPIPVFVSAWAGGLLPGLFATALGCLAGAYFFLDPQLTFDLSGPGPMVHVLLFIFEGSLAAFVAEKALYHKRDARRSRQAAAREHDALLLSEAKVAEGRDRLQLALSATRMGTWDYDPVTNALVWDQRTREIHDVGPDEEITFELYMSRIHPEDRDATLRAIEAAMSQATERFYVEFRLATSGSSKERWVSGTGRVICDPQGRPVRFIGVSEDITERIEQAERLKKSESEFRLLAETIPPMVWITGATGKTLYFNRRWYEFTGLSEATSYERGWSQLLHPDDLAKTLQAWALSLDTGEDFETEFRMRNSKGEYRWQLARARAVRDPDGSIAKWFGTCSDIDDQKRGEEALRRTGEELEQMVRDRTIELTNTNHELEAFSYSVSHDLRTPLRSIEGFSQALLEDELPRLSERGQKDLHRIRAASQRMGRIIDDLLNLSRLSRTELRKQPVNLAEITHAQLTSLAADEPQRKVTVEIAEVPPAYGDPGLLSVLIQNLLANAWKFTSQAPSPRIEVGSQEQDGETVYFVRDNGAGFDMSYYDKLFGAFQRLHRNSEFGGTGIGLATARRIVHRHGGKIWAEGQVGLGATFYFTLGMTKSNYLEPARPEEKTV